MKNLISTNRKISNVFTSLCVAQSNQNQKTFRKVLTKQSKGLYNVLTVRCKEILRFCVLDYANAYAS
ncbi:MAG: hypothetical protein R3Y12_09090 [Clostridia bacterium]